MSYPNAYCVKCGKQTESLDKHTIVMQNGVRAVKGVCADCRSQVYKIVPKMQDFHAPKAKGGYPDAFCLKCRAHMPTANARTVVLENQSRALTGNCGECGSEVYRILPPRRNPGTSATLRILPSDRGGSTTQKMTSDTIAPLMFLSTSKERLAQPAEARDKRFQSRRRPEALSLTMAKSLWIAATVIAVIVATFFTYSLLT